MSGLQREVGEPGTDEAARHVVRVSLSRAYCLTCVYY